MSGKTILVIEDDKAISADLELLLSSEGYRVTCAANGKDALAALRASAELPSLLLLDIMMPVMDGWQFRSEQSADPKLSSIPVVVMTADGQAAQKAAKMNAQGFVQKPFDIDRLLAVVAKAAA